MIKCFNKYLDENLAWLTQKAEESKCVQGHFTHTHTHTHTQMQLNCEVMKKVATPHFSINPPFSGLSPHSSKMFGTPLPQVTQFFFF